MTSSPTGLRAAWRKPSTYAAVGALLALLALQVSLATGASGTAGSTAQVLLPTQTLPLHQTPPIVNSGFAEKGTCPGSPAQWGWHFVLPTDDAAFVSLTTTFTTAGTIVTTVFGPPTTKHAYVYTATNDTLLSAGAVVTGGEDLEWFNLSHTCAGGGSSPSPSPSETVSESPSPSPSETVSESPSPSPSPSPSASATVSESPSPSPSETVTESPSPSPSETVSESPSGSPTPEVSASETEQPSPSVSASVKGVKIVKNLPQTGSPMPLGRTVAGALLAVALGCLAVAAGLRRTDTAGGTHRN